MHFDFVVFYLWGVSWETMLLAFAIPLWRSCISIFDLGLKCMHQWLGQESLMLQRETPHPQFSRGHFFFRFTLNGLRKIGAAHSLLGEAVDSRGLTVLPPPTLRGMILSAALSCVFFCRGEGGCEVGRGGGWHSCSFGGLFF